MLGYEVVDGEYPGRSVLDLPEERTLLFGCRPDLLSTARIQGHKKYIYHFGNRPEEFYDLAKDPSRITTSSQGLAERIWPAGAERFWSGTPKRALPTTGTRN